MRREVRSPCGRVGNRFSEGSKAATGFIGTYMPGDSNRMGSTRRFTAIVSGRKDLRFLFFKMFLAYLCFIPFLR